MKVPLYSEPRSFQGSFETSDPRLFENKKNYKVEKYFIPTPISNIAIYTKTKKMFCIPYKYEYVVYLNGILPCTTPTLYEIYEDMPTFYEIYKMLPPGGFVDLSTCIILTLMLILIPILMFIHLIKYDTKNSLRILLYWSFKGYWNIGILEKDKNEIAEFISNSLIDELVYCKTLLTLLIYEVFKVCITNYIRPNLPSFLQPQPQPQPNSEQHKIQFQMMSDNAEFFKEDDCVCCLNSSNQENTIAFDCNHVTCTQCATIIIKKFDANCPTCRAKISTIKFTNILSPDNYNALFSSLTNNKPLIL